MLTSSRLYTKEFTFDKSSSINRLFTKNCVTRMEILLVSYLMYVIFISSLGSFFQQSEFNNTLLYQNERGGNTATRTSTSLSHSIRVLSLLLSLCKNHKKPEVNKKI